MVFGVVMHPVRMMVTGKSVGADMTKTLELLGKEECLKRIDYFLEKNSKGEFGE